VFQFCLEFSFFHFDCVFSLLLSRSLCLSVSVFNTEEKQKKKNKTTKLKKKKNRLFLPLFFVDFFFFYKRNDKLPKSSSQKFGSKNLKISSLPW